MIAFLIVLAYMVFYYSHRAGLVADTALLVNMFFMMGVLASLNAVLTLPGYRRYCSYHRYVGRRQRSYL
jgi:SecD/SecF fusion protein